MKPTLVLAALLVLSASARGDSCGPTIVSDLVGTTCTISDVQFTFTNYSTYGIDYATENGADTSFPASSVTFTPDATPGNPGFALSGTFNFDPISYPAGYESGGYLDYTVQVLGGNSIIETSNGLDSWYTPSSATGFSSAWSETGYCGIASGFMEFRPPGSITTSTYGSTFPASQSCGDVFTDFKYSAHGFDQSFSFDTSASTHFEETTAVPEPGSLVLLGTGFLGVAEMLRRRRKGA